jgi:hypothetical protein
MRTFLLIVGIILFGSALYLARLTMRVRDRGDTLPAYFQAVVLAVVAVAAIVGFVEPTKGRYLGFAVAALLIGDVVILGIWKHRRT